MLRTRARCALIVSAEGQTRPTGVTTPTWLLEALLATELDKVSELRVADVQVPLEIALAYGSAADRVVPWIEGQAVAWVPRLAPTRREATQVHL